MGRIHKKSNKTKEYTKEEILAAINGSHNIISQVAKKLDCSWDTAKKYINKWQLTKDAFYSEQEIMIDFAEGKMYEAINKGDPGMIKWFLSKKAKHRGYGDEENTVPQVDNKIEITIEDAPTE